MFLTLALVILAPFWHDRGCGVRSFPPCPARCQGSVFLLPQESCPSPWSSLRSSAGVWGCRTGQRRKVAGDWHSHAETCLCRDRWETWCWVLSWDHSLYPCPGPGEDWTWHSERPGPLETASQLCEDQRSWSRSASWRTTLVCWGQISGRAGCWCLCCSGSQRWEVALSLAGAESRAWQSYLRAWGCWASGPRVAPCLCLSCHCLLPGVTRRGSWVSGHCWDHRGGQVCWHHPPLRQTNPSPKYIRECQ